MVEDSRGRYEVWWQRMPYEPAGERRRDVLFGEVAELRGPEWEPALDGRLWLRVEDNGEVIVEPDPRGPPIRVSHTFRRPGRE